METYIFKKVGFKDHQSEKLKSPGKRMGILIDANINNNPKILALYAEKDVSLLAILLEIWANLDLETETWEVQTKHFDQWVKKTFGGSNRFDVLKRLQWLSNNGLIEFQHVSNDPLTTSYSPSNDVLTDSYHGSNTPLEQTEKPVVLRATKQTNKQIPVGASADAEVDISTPESIIWKDGVSMLVKARIGEESARRMLGLLVKNHGKAAVAEAVTETVLADTGDPKAYINGILKNQKQKAVSGHKPPQSRFVSEQEQKANDTLARFARQAAQERQKRAINEATANGN